MTADNEPKLETRKKTLLQKYEIPLNHLDFDYIKGCSNIIELERIVRILRSNEEGCYPDLLRCTEERLRELSPNSKILRVSTPAITKNQLPNSEWKAVENELLNWKNEVSEVERKLSRWKDHPEPTTAYPQVRKPSVSSSAQPPVGEQIKKPSPGTDYKKWEMFDADSECLKLDLEQERKAEERKIRELEEKKKAEVEAQLSLEEKEIRAIIGTAEGLSEEERKILSLKEKELGNEFYQTNRLDNALRHYTRSIYLYPTAVSYNNRAATYLKQCRFSKALDDLNIVIEMEPNNVKARYRRAMAFQHKNEFRKALDDVLVVLKHQPNHVLARHVADQLRENCASLPRKHRIKVRDENNPKQLIVKEVTEEELKRDYQDIDYLEVNDNGLPKIMCNCNGKYTNDPIMKNNDPLKYQQFWYQQEKYRNDHLIERNGKRTTDTNLRMSEVQVGVNKRNKPLEGARRLDIAELEKIEEEEGRLPLMVADMRSDKSKKVSGDSCDPESTKSLKTKEEKMTFNADIQASERNVRDKMDEFYRDKIGFEDEAIHPWGPPQGYGLKLNPQSPVSNSSVNGEFSSDIDSDDDEFPDDSSCKVNIKRVEKLMDNDVDTISKDLFPDEDLAKCECGEGYRISSSQFESKWHELEDSLDQRSRLIRLLCPHMLSSVIGNKLDEKLLSGFFTCLSTHFDEETEKDLIVSYLDSISRLQRFRIITSFLSSSDRAVVNNLLKKLHPINNNIEEAFIP